ncbi:CPBP family intramembrane glutamic endopeptidase [Bacillus toyonensis]|uniref:CPBP family intramembrane glutamic endopeptidase n=1 Tax=Bacillus toyonensis TaxID=155322 RepID=UPI003D1EE14F
MKKLQWIVFLLLETFLILLFALNNTSEIFMLFVFIQLQMFVNLTARHIQDTLFKNADWLRRTVYFIPYTIAILFFSPILFFDASITRFSISALLAVLIGIVFLIPRLGEIKPFYNKELALFFPPVTFRKASIETYSLLVSAILQELFYKLFVMGLLIPIFGTIFSVIISAVLFVADHFIHARATMFRISDYLAQFLLSTCAGFLYVYSGSVWSAVLLHLTFNTPLAFSFFFRYWVITKDNTKKAS